MKKTLRSTRLGTFTLNEEIEGFPMYTTNTSVGPHADVDVTLNSNGSEDVNFEQTLSSAERRIDAFIATEPEIRRALLPGLRTSIKEFTGVEWRGSDQALISQLKLMNLNFTNDGTMEVWYHCNEPTDYHDVVVELDADMMVQEVSLDG